MALYYSVRENGRSDWLIQGSQEKKHKYLRFFPTIGNMQNQNNSYAMFFSSRKRARNTQSGQETQKKRTSHIFSSGQKEDSRVLLSRTEKRSAPVKSRPAFNP
jgi:hypothetical protein